MIEFLHSLSTREISILIWTIIVFSIFIFIARREFLNVLKAFFHYKIISSLIALLCYCLLAIYFLYKISFWDFALLKDTLIWFLTAGLVMFFNINKVNTTNYFIGIFNDNLKIILFLEFIINFYTFEIITELILVPIISLVTILFEYSKLSIQKNPNHIKANKLLQSILLIFGISILIYISYKTFVDYKNLLTEDNIKSFYLPIILTLITFPFYYFLALIIIYEEFFVRINCMFNDRDKVKEIKKNILINANINLNKITKIKNSFEKKCIYEQSVNAYIKSISK
ncbi:hypothetical protein MUU74_15275 [Chryseobacterium daecheongense]|uniref:hypothetical protein n=1 Tax=Chryseobacterium daecheongense TaxID=192389 RepID=UPI001FD6EFB4|nr:hypothetical protein [Chryseobacterium daecheongense]UOU97844.1 hypothetical protein MUU74_15275 [Chryseobacterium daecheongense]